MSVSYRFHAYSPQRMNPGRRLRAKARQLLTQSELAAHAVETAGLQYGRQFAETEMRGHERLEAASFRDESEAHAPPSWGPAGSAPIGALPQTDEPISRPERVLSGEGPQKLDALVSEAMRDVEVWTSAIRDLGGSSWRLARFPWEAARALRQRRRRK